MQPLNWRGLTARLSMLFFCPLAFYFWIKQFKNSLFWYLQMYSLDIIIIWICFLTKEVASTSFYLIQFKLEHIENIACGEMISSNNDDAEKETIVHSVTSLSRPHPVKIGSTVSLSRQSRTPALLLVSCYIWLMDLYVLTSRRLTGVKLLPGVGVSVCSCCVCTFDGLVTIWNETSNPWA